MDTPGTYENHLSAAEPRWFAVYTKYKREKLVHKRLTESGVESYLPIITLSRRYGNRIRTVELPLIGTYIFTRITKAQYVTVLRTLDVVGFVKFSQNLIAIPDDEIRILQRVVGQGIEVEVEPNGYRVGDEVEIIGGNLTGVKGILQATDQNKNFVIELNQIGYSLRIQVEPAMLRPIRKAAGAV
ncbi:MAG TPA: UpxY family transcription antiterminator [Flavilitoribacter sp.]|nr:UpxY family transcription antiterminator [Flavilitoribacter sp.]HMQ87383.1 UpxY family transcription antiterminator [Flavilitoribacter sp.]